MPVCYWFIVTFPFFWQAIRNSSMFLNIQSSVKGIVKRKLSQDVEIPGC